MNRRVLLCAATLLGVSACENGMPTPPEPAYSYGATGSVYRVTIENLTGGQPLTPPVIVAHRAATHLFRVGEAASEGVRQIAENGNLNPMLAAVGSDPHVSDFAFLPGPTVPPVLGGQSVTGELRATLGATRFSWVSMLICTNDGFTGVNSAKLPTHVGQSVVHVTNGYDAGTELNTEDFDDLVPPCGPLTGVDSMGRGTGTSNPALAEGGVIHHHPGVQGIADLIPAVHGWTNPVARVTITRIE